jgi:homeobox protein cut-like
MPAIDSAASDLVAHQRDSLVQRKDLAQKTKDFRKLDDGSKLTEIKSILKAYQTYIDGITNQSKAIHSAFLQIYTPISEAPDPYPLLEASVDSLVTAEETLPKIKDENEQLRKQVNKLTSDLDEAEKRLDQERAMRKSLEDSRDEKIKSVETSWNAVLKEKQDNWESKEKSLEEKVEHQDRLIKEIKASHEVSERMNKDDSNTSANVTNAELEIVHSELDRANMRLAEVEARNEQLRLDLAQSASNSPPKTKVEEDPAFLRLQSENSSLMRRMESSRIDKESDKRKWTEQVRVLEREVAALQRDRDAMRQKIGQWKDYENIKQELEVLKVILFPLLSCSHTDLLSLLNLRLAMMKITKSSPALLQQQPMDLEKHSNNFFYLAIRSYRMNSPSFESLIKIYRLVLRPCKKKCLAQTWNLRSQETSVQRLKAI